MVRSNSLHRDSNTHCCLHRELIIHPPSYPRPGSVFDSTTTASTGPPGSALVSRTSARATIASCRASRFLPYDKQNIKEINDLLIRHKVNHNNNSNSEDFQALEIGSYQARIDLRTVRLLKQIYFKIRITFKADMGTDWTS